MEPQAENRSRSRSRDRDQPNQNDATEEDEIEMCKRKLFIGNLSYETTDKDLFEAFSKCGQIIEATVMSERESGKSRGFGFVTYTTIAEAEDAFLTLQGAPIRGREVRIDRSVPKNSTKSRTGDRNKQDHHGRKMNNPRGRDYDDRYGDSRGGGGGNMRNYDNGPSRMRGGPPPTNSQVDTTSNVCFAFQRGQCKYGDRCIYSHDLSQLDRTRGGGGGGPPLMRNNDRQYPPHISSHPSTFDTNIPYRRDDNRHDNYPPHGGIREGRSDAYRPDMSSGNINNGPGYGGGGAGGVYGSGPPRGSVSGPSGGGYGTGSVYGSNLNTGSVYDGPSNNSMSPDRYPPQQQQRSTYGNQPGPSMNRPDTVASSTYRGPAPQYPGSNNPTYPPSNMPPLGGDRVGPPYQQVGGGGPRPNPGYMPRDGPMNPRDGPMNPRDGPMNPRDGPINPRDGPMNPRDGPMNPRDGPMNPRDGPMNPRDGPINPRDGPLNPRDGPMNPRDGPMNPRDGPMRDDRRYGRGGYPDDDRIGGGVGDGGRLMQGGYPPSQQQQSPYGMNQRRSDTDNPGYYMNNNNIPRHINPNLGSGPNPQGGGNFNNVDNRGSDGPPSGGYSRGPPTQGNNYMNARPNMNPSNYHPDDNMSRYPPNNGHGSNLGPHSGNRPSTYGGGNQMSPQSRSHNPDSIPDSGRVYIDNTYYPNNDRSSMNSSSVYNPNSAPYSPTAGNMISPRTASASNGSSSNSGKGSIDNGAYDPLQPSINIIKG